MFQQLSITGVKTIHPSKKKSPSFRFLLNERIATYGVETITETEILSALTDIPLEKLKASIDELGMLDFARSIDSLDITDAQRRKLSLVFEIARKISSSRVKQKEALDSSVKAGEYFKRLLATKTVEEFTLAFLDTQNRIIKTVTAFKGTLNETAVYTREIVKMALFNNAVSIVIAHNHPSGSTQPSQADIATTKNIKEALHTVQIKIIDHIIVCGDTYVSFAERGLL